MDSSEAAERTNKERDMPIQWEIQEPGWWTSEIGGICSDGAGKWFFWPKSGQPTDERVGPWKSLKQAKEKAVAHTLALTNGESNT